MEDEFFMDAENPYFDHLKLRTDEQTSDLKTETQNPGTGPTSTGSEHSTDGNRMGRNGKANPETKHRPGITQRI